MAEPMTPPAPILLAWVTEGRRALVVGGGWISTRRVRALLDGKATVHVVSPTLTPELAERVESGEVTADVRRWQPSDLEGADLVLVAIDEHPVSKAISHAARARRIPVHVSDAPPLCDFYFAATTREGPVQIAISTGGAGPALAGRLRDRIREALPAGVGAAVERFGLLRQAVRRAMPQDDQGPARMKFLGDYGRGTSWGDLAALDDARIVELADEAAGE